MRAKQSTPQLNPSAPPIKVDRILLRREEAAQSIGVSVDHFDRNVRPFLRHVRIGRVTLYAPRELERFVSEHTEPSPYERLGQ
ncbi:MAG: hypothetical protein ACPGYP_06105 [Solirubrobacterales bacterium]